jgi:hypothetical protein
LASILIFVAELAENLLRIGKDWKANSPAWPDNQGANPMLPNDKNLVGVEEEVKST